MSWRVSSTVVNVSPRTRLSSLRDRHVCITVSEFCWFDGVEMRVMGWWSSVVKPLLLEAKAQSAPPLFSGTTWGVHPQFVNSSYPHVKPRLSQRKDNSL